MNYIINASSIALVGFIFVLTGVTGMPESVAAVSYSSTAGYSSSYNKPSYSSSYSTPSYSSSYSTPSYSSSYSKPSYTSSYSTPTYSSSYSTPSYTSSYSTPSYSSSYSTPSYSSSYSKPSYISSYSTPTYSSSYSTPSYSSSYTPSYTSSYTPTYTSSYTPTYSSSYTPTYTSTYTPTYTTPTYSVSNYSPTSYTYNTPKYKVVTYNASNNYVNTSTNNPVAHQPTCTITASPNSVNYGGASTLFWSSNYATSATLSSVGSVSTNGSHVFSSLQSTQTYTLTVSGAGGTNTCTTTVGVTSQPPVSYPSCTLTANPNPINSGNSSTLSWTTTNASSASIDSIGNVTTGSGSQTIYPTHSKQYSMTVYNSNGQSNTCTTYVTLNSNQSNLWCSINIQPQYVTQNGSAVLTWTSGGATNAWISNGVGNVSSNGNTTVYPNGTQTYTLTVSNGSNTQTCSTVVNNTTYTGGTSYVSLNQIPYTGFDFGFFGNLVYWMFLVLGAAAAAYLLTMYRGGLMQYAFAGRGIVASEDDLDEEVAEEVIEQNADDNREGPGVGDSMELETVDGIPRLVIKRDNTGTEGLPGQE